MDARSPGSDALPHFIVLLEAVAEPLHILHRRLKLRAGGRVSRDASEVVRFETAEGDEVGLNLVNQAHIPIDAAAIGGNVAHNGRIGGFSHGGVALVHGHKARRGGHGIERGGIEPWVRHETDGDRPLGGFGLKNRGGLLARIRPRHPHRHLGSAHGSPAEQARH